MNTPYMEVTRKLSFLIILSILLPFFAYHTSRIIVRAITGTTLWTEQHNLDQLIYDKNLKTDSRRTLEMLLSDQDLPTNERQKLEEQKRVLEKRLKGDKLTPAQTTSLQIQKKKVEEEEASLEKEFKTLKEINKNLHAKQELIFFLITTIFGLLALICGCLIPIGYLGAGLILGSLFCIFIGFFSFWGHFNDWLKLLLLLLALITTLAMGYRIAIQKEQ